MKTAISVDGDLLHEADETARRLGLSRSRLFSIALRDYLALRRREQTLEQLNRVYGDAPKVEERRSAAGLKAKFRSTIKDRW